MTSTNGNYGNQLKYGSSKLQPASGVGYLVNHNQNQYSDAQISSAQYSQPDPAPADNPDLLQSKPRPYVGFIGALRNYFKYMFRFSGRASRSEFWWVQVFWALIWIIFSCVIFVCVFIYISNTGVDTAGSSASTRDFTASFVLTAMILFYASIPLGSIQFVMSLGLNWRRVQDTGNPGALSLISLALPISMLVFGRIQSSPKGYQFDEPDDLNRP